MRKRAEERTEELTNFVMGEPVFPEVVETVELVDEPNLEEVITLDQEKVSEIIEENNKTNFLKIARLYNIGDHGFVALNLADKEKRVVRNDNIYFATAEKRFAMTPEEWNELELLKDFKL